MAKNVTLSGYDKNMNPFDSDDDFLEDDQP